MNMPKHMRKKNVELNHAILEHAHPTSQVMMKKKTK
jgi:hypothetical protein